MGVVRRPTQPLRPTRFVRPARSVCLDVSDSMRDPKGRYGQTKHLVFGRSLTSIGRKRWSQGRKRTWVRDPVPGRTECDPDVGSGTGDETAFVRGERVGTVGERRVYVVRPGETQSEGEWSTSTVEVHRLPRRKECRCIYRRQTVRLDSRGRREIPLFGEPVMTATTDGVIQPDGHVQSRTARTHAPCF